jgi:5-methyltetrahydrofolate--homocysteine methyltransferase
VSAWRERLNDKKLLVLDGAWGTQLAERGLPTGEAPERWNLEHPDDVRAIARDYAEAGADIVLTNTFGANRAKLEKSGLDAELIAVNRKGVELSCEGAAGRSLVFASVGPTGEFMAPLGDVSEVEMVHCFAEQVKALVAGGCDGVVIETMTDLNEAKAALRAAKANCDLPVAVSMTFDKGPGGYATMMGVRPAQAAADLTAAGADIVGANCGSGVEDIVEIIRLMRPATDALLWAKPNAGLPQLVNGRTVFKETPEAVVAKVPALVEAGAHHIGGCCGTTPDHVRMFRMCADNLRRSEDSYLNSMQAWGR